MALSVERKMPHLTVAKRNQIMGMFFMVLILYFLFYFEIHVSDVTFAGKYTRVDPLTSILAVLARSCQILITFW